MVKEVKSIEDANVCDELLTKLILDEKKYNDLIDDNIIVRDHFNKMLNDKNIVLLAYYSEQKIVGYILVRKIDLNVCLLDGLYVLEEYRNQGIANTLLNEAMNQCKKMGAKYVDINVMKKNDIAKHIYKELDFIEYEIKLRRKI
ncbi:MAG: GNAT family N-acetyltransferase [Firmicutes bacterium]|nr:GNAT family N-acetyltransferase [Bacillota bacterium]